ncbi:MULTISPECIES: endonuclease domain-containing protein [unclassified Microbacterium]|uniref:endonuclease domain-containing protein n=2 Tax=Microbacterium TaxID=33882 RepID=UPI0020066ED8|nr:MULTISPECIES: hypothetical protein [unclassified Microbacterium]
MDGVAMWESERRAFRERAGRIIATPVWGASDLRAAGMGGTERTAALSNGSVIRARRDRYLAGDAAPELIAAVAAGGVLTCVSALRLLGVFVLDEPGLHVRVDPHSTRLPPAPGIVRHWLPPIDAPQRHGACADPMDMVAHAVRCQPPRAAIATLDSALHLGLIPESDVPRVFAALPRRYRPLRMLIDPRAESGPETLARLLLRGLSRRVEIQVRIDGVGRVDLLVDGWLVIECDSEAHHSGPRAYRTDRSRDLALAERGYAMLRLSATDLMWHPERVIAAVRGLMATRRRRG